MAQAQFYPKEVYRQHPGIGVTGSVTSGVITRGMWWYTSSSNPRQVYDIITPTYGSVPQVACTDGDAYCVDIVLVNASQDEVEYVRDAREYMYFKG